MAKLTFKGGIHPYDGKDLSKDKPIKDVLPKGEMVYPLSQHIGAPAQALVAKGDRVLAGQKIAEAGGFVSAAVYATVSGTVKNIESRRVASGDMVMSIIVDNDGQYEEVADTNPPASAIFCPARTRSPLATRACAGAPMCWDNG